MGRKDTHHEVVLLVTVETPDERREAHLEYIMNALHRERHEVEVRLVGAELVIPSTLGSSTTYVFADSSVSSVSDALSLARDWQEEWFIYNRRDVSARTAPLYLCRTNPGARKGYRR